MNKQLLLNTLSKTFLNLSGTDDNLIFFNIENNNLKLKSYNVAHKSTVISTVIINNFDMNDCHFAIRDPDRLLKILNLCKDELSLSISSKYDIRLNINDSKIITNFVLADTKVLSESIKEQYEVEVDEPNQYDLIIPITQDFHETFSKLKKALGSNVFNVDTMINNVHFTLGEGNDYTTRSSYAIEQYELINEVNELSFSTDTLISIMDKNKNCDGKMFINSEGLMKIQYNNSIEESNQIATYFMFALDQL